jgi:hypothetical protein
MDDQEQRKTHGSHPELEELITKVELLPLSRLAEATGMNRQAVQQYLMYYPDLHRTWRDNQTIARRRAREEKEQRPRLERERERERIEQLMETDWPRAMALTYLLCPGTKLPEERVAKLLAIYKDALDEGRYISSLDLARRSGIEYASTVLRILKTLRLKPLPPELRGPLREAALRGFSYGLSAEDTAYFLKAERAHVRGLHREERAPNSQFDNLRRDSRVYELRDKVRREGGSLDEIAEREGIEPQRVEISLRRERYKAPAIIEAIRKMYLNNEHELPYVTPALRLPT